MAIVSMRTALCPHLEECEQSATTGEDDVELGICIYQHLGIQCMKPKKVLKICRI